MRIEEKMHIVDPDSPMKSIPVGKAQLPEGQRTINVHSKTYCGEDTEHRATLSFYQATNYTGAGLIRKHDKVCEDCARALLMRGEAPCEICSSPANCIVAGEKKLRYLCSFCCKDEVQAGNILAPNVTVNYCPCPKCFNCNCGHQRCPNTGKCCCAR